MFPGYVWAPTVTPRMSSWRAVWITYSPQNYWLWRQVCFIVVYQRDLHHIYQCINRGRHNWAISRHMCLLSPAWKLEHDKWQSSSTPSRREWLSSRQAPSRLSNRDSMNGRPTMKSGRNPVDRNGVCDCSTHFIYEVRLRNSWNLVMTCACVTKKHCYRHRHRQCQKTAWWIDGGVATSSQLVFSLEPRPQSSWHVTWFSW